MNKNLEMGDCAELCNYICSYMGPYRTTKEETGVMCFESEERLYFTQYDNLQVHPRCCKWHCFILFYEGEPTCQCRRHKRCRFDIWVRKIPWRGACHLLQYSCLENPMDRGAWQATIYRIIKSWTRSKQLSTHICNISLYIQQTKTNIISLITGV